MSARCSIVIPVHGQAALTRRCLERVLAHDGARAEVIVVDDASPDNTRAVLARYGARITVITHECAAGFAATCNDGAAAAKTEWLAFLNNDTLPMNGWLDAMLAHAAETGAAVVGARLLYPDGAVQHAGVTIGRDGNPRHLYSGFPGEHPAVVRSRALQAVTAACMLVRRDVFRALRGFDTAFRNGYEDVDFCLRAGERGHEVRYCGPSVGVHLERATRAGRSREDRENLRLFRRRWAGRVLPDETRLYEEDGLLRLDHTRRVPGVRVSPELGSVVATDADETGDGPARLLAWRTRQLMDLRREVLRLDAWLSARAISNAAPADRVVRPRAAAAARTVHVATRHETAGLDWTALARAHEALFQLDEQLIGSLHGLQLSVAAAQPAAGDSAGCQAPGFCPGHALTYRLLCARVRAIARAVLPRGALVLVASGGDDRLLELDGPRGWHYPRAADGSHPGFHPGDAAEAIDHLEELRARGAEYILFPHTATWWLDAYPRLAAHLEDCYERLVRVDACTIYHLSQRHARSADRPAGGWTATWGPS